MVFERFIPYPDIPPGESKDLDVRGSNLYRSFDFTLRVTLRMTKNGGIVCEAVYIPHCATIPPTPKKQKTDALPSACFICLRVLDKLFKSSDLDAGAKDLSSLLDLVKLGEGGGDTEIAVLGIAAVGIG